jgi:hypothetical protein
MVRRPHPRRAIGPASTNPAARYVDRLLDQASLLADAISILRARLNRDGPAWRVACTDQRELPAVDLWRFGAEAECEL